MGQIARFTTPVVAYKPRAVQIETIEQIYLVLKQGGRIIVQKGKDEATVTESGFLWTLTQEETSILKRQWNLVVQVDYKTETGMRYTTTPREYAVTDSGLNEVI